MKKFIATCLFLAIVAIGGGGVYAMEEKGENSVFTVEQYNIMEQTTELLQKNKDSMLSEEELKELGWEIVQTETKNDVMSASGYGSITNYFMKSTSNPGMYLAQAIWNYSRQDLWDRYSHRANDYLGIAITDLNDNAIKAVATNAGIKVQDVDYATYPGYGSVNDYSQSGATYLIEDKNTYGVGMNGSAWFYINKPTDLKDNQFKIRSRWVHTWHDTKDLSLSSLTLSYPFSVSATFSDNGTKITPSSWAAADQDPVSF